MTRSGYDARRPPEATIPAGGSAPARQSRASDIEARAAARLIALTANPHPLFSKESALHHGPVSTAYLTSLRGLPATLERLRIDCQLTEATATGFYPLHLAEVFGISEHIAIRYTVNARQLTGWAHQQAPRIP
jgi:hypothetical protein